MRKIFCSLSLCGLLSLSLLCGCDVSSMSTLSDISKPFVGEYACGRLLLNGEDVLPQYEYVKLSLDYDGSFGLSFCGVDGNEDEYHGGYRVLTNDEQIEFTFEEGLNRQRRVFPLKDGVIYIDLLFRNALLHAEFSMP